MTRYLRPSRIEFWIVIFFIIRLIGITNPPLEIGHNWRQVTGLMVARNFLEVDNNIQYPRIDDHQGRSGIIGMEFPILNYLHYLFSLVNGYTHWYGRIINLLISSIGIYFFYKTIAKYINGRIGFYSSIILLCSIWFSFSRKMMPDTFCISLFFIGMYYGLNYLFERKRSALLLYIFFCGLGLLAKIPAGIYLAIFCIPLFTKVVDQKKKIIFSLSTLLILALTYWWYFIHNPHLSVQFGNWYNSGKPIAEGFNEIRTNLPQVFEKFYFSAFSSYLFFGLFLVGLFLIIKYKAVKLQLIFVSVFTVFIIYIFKSGFFFHHHNYYIIPFVPVMAVIAAYPLTLIKNQKLLTALLLICSIEAIANQQHDFFIKDGEKYKLKLELIADQVSKRTDLIAINGNENPQQIYLAHRKGWNCKDQQINEAYLSEIKAKGAKYIFINKHTFNGKLNKKLVYSDEDYEVYEI